MAEKETRIIRQAIKGDRMAFRTLVLEHSHAMFRLAWRLTQDEHLAEDVVQEAFLKAYRKIGDFNLEASFGTWMHRITVNTAMDQLRKLSTRNRHESPEPDWTEATAPSSSEASIGERDDIRRHAEAAMKELTDLERTAFTLRHFEGHSIAEISDILEMKDNACKQAIFRAVKKMRTALQPLVTT
jgi:RNA polymerase sigma-70 factor (ECF subfamily)